MEKMSENRPLAVFSRGGAMFSNLWSVVGFLSWAEKAGYIPIVDFSETPPPNRWVGDGDREGWTDYFEPVSPQSRNKDSLKKAFVFEERPTEFPIQDYSTSVDYVRVFHRYIALNKSSKAFLQPWLSALEQYPSTLGVHIRGTDMKVARSHWAPPTHFQIGHTVDEALERSDFSHILVATEDSRALHFMLRRYGGRVITTDSIRTTEKRKLVHLSSSIPQYRYFLGLQVLRDAWLLASCAGFVSGHSNVSEHVQVIAPKPFKINLQIRRPQVDILGSHPFQIRITNLVRELTTSRWRGKDFRVLDRTPSE